MAPVRMKTRSDVGIKETHTSKPKHPSYVVSKRKAEGSPHKPATTAQIKRHLIENPAKDTSVIMKTKAQLLNISGVSVKKPLGTRTVNSSINVIKDTSKTTLTTKKDIVIKSDSKENIVSRVSVAKISDNVKTTITLKSKSVKETETKTNTVKSLTTKPLGFKDINKCYVKPVETKSKTKVEPKQVGEVKDKVPLKQVENRRNSLIPISLNTTKIQVNKKVETTVSVRTTGPVTRQSLNRRSTDSESTLYESALEDVFDYKLVLVNRLNDSSGSKKSTKPNSLRRIKEHRKRPPGVEDFDLACQDLTSVGKFAFQIFEYLKSRESIFTISNYMPKQRYINMNIRATVVDWLAELQENFEFNHETLYLAVKIMDRYLSKVVISKDQLQLVVATTMLISCKYEERITPLLDDFIDVSDHSFTIKDMMDMECKIMKTIGFDIGCPLSYRFLRRYARCAKFGMPLLTLARYILELSLMEYSMCLESESKVASAALYLAMRMKKESVWTPTLEYYSGYKVEDFKDIVLELNAMLHKPIGNLNSIRKKYSHEIFHKVTEVPLLDQVDFPTYAS